MVTRFVSTSSLFCLFIVSIGLPSSALAFIDQDKCTEAHGWFVDMVKISPCQRPPGVEFTDARLTQTVTVGDGGQLFSQTQDCEGRQMGDSGTTLATGSSYIYTCVHVDPRGFYTLNDGPSVPDNVFTSVAATLGLGFLPGAPAHYRELFWDAGVHHDFCYHHNKASYGLSKHDCDLMFRNDMYLTCTSEEMTADCFDTAEIFYQAVVQSDAGTSAWLSSNTHVDYLRAIPGDGYAAKYSMTPFPSEEDMRSQALAQLPPEALDFPQRPALTPRLQAIIDHYVDQSLDCGPDDLCVTAKLARLYRNLYYYLDVQNNRYAVDGTGNWTFSDADSDIESKIDCAVCDSSSCTSFPVPRYQIEATVASTGQPVPLWAAGFFYVDVDFVYGHVIEKCYLEGNPNAVWVPSDATFWRAQFLEHLQTTKATYGWPLTVAEISVVTSVL